MAKVKVPRMNNCRCGETPSLHHHTAKGAFSTFIICECGMLTKSFSSKIADVSKKNCITAWNKKASKRPKDKTTGIKSCEKCGSTDVHLYEYEMKYQSTFMVRCDECGIQTEEMKINGNFLTKEEAIVLWNK